jgi:DNA-binding transcriptional MerR regulator
MKKTHATSTPPAAESTAAAEAARTTSAPGVSAHFKTSEVVDLLDLSRRQLQYWAKTGLVEPSARTPGGHHRYDFNDLVALKATRRLIDAGVSVQKIRKSVGALRELLPQVGRPLSELVLVATGDVVLVFHDETVFEAITGQEWVFPVAAFQREVWDFRFRQRSRQEADARSRDATRSAASADSDGNGDGRGVGKVGGRRGRRPERRAPVYAVERSSEPAARPVKPTVRSTKQGRKRWSETG